MPAGFELCRSLTKNEQKPVEATLAFGKIPEWINGTLFRNGSGRFELENGQEYKHLFDGLACVHKYKIENGRVFYSNRFIETDCYKKARDEKRLMSAFGTPDLCSTAFKRFKAVFTKNSNNPPDNTNVNVMPYGNQELIALTETRLMWQIDAKTLESIKRFNITDEIPTASTTIAHPHVLNDGSWITMGMSIAGLKNNYEFLRFKSRDDKTDSSMTEQAEVIGRIPSSHSMGLSYIHSFGLTQNYIIFLECALVFDLTSYMKNIFYNLSFADCLKMRDNFLTRVHIMNIKTGELAKQTFVTDPLFVFHHINAYEKHETNEIICDVCAYDPKYFDIKGFQRETIFTDKTLNSKISGSIGKRITIPLNKVSENSVNSQIHCDIQNINSGVAFELPNINYSDFNTKPYKYMYGANVFSKKPFSIVKLNVDSGEYLEKRYEEKGRAFLPTEPIFAKNPHGKEEDDGVLLVMVLSDKGDFLSVLDAKDLKEIARAEIPEDVKGAFTFHGFYASKENFPKLNE